MKGFLKIVGRIIEDRPQILFQITGIDFFVIARQLYL